jgi:hypothetical protein
MTGSKILDLGSTPAASALIRKLKILPIYIEVGEGGCVTKV